MSFRALLDRSVTVTPRSPAPTTDSRGNEVLVDGTPVEVRTRRELFTGSEETRDRERGDRLWLYFFEAGVDVDRLSRIDDGDEELEVEVVDEVSGRRGIHHLEVLARLVEG